MQQVSIKSTRLKSKSLFESFRLIPRAFVRTALTAPALDRSGFRGTRPRKPHNLVRGESPSDNSPLFQSYKFFDSLSKCHFYIVKMTLA